MGRRCRIDVMQVLGLALAAAILLPLQVEGTPRALTTYRDPIPTNKVFCPLSDSTVSLKDALVGKPLAIFVTDLSHGVDNPMGDMLVEYQPDYWPWFSWAGVLVGTATAEDVLQMRSRSQVRFEFCYQDVSGQWQSALNVSRLPSLVLVNEDGFIIDRFEGAEMKDRARLAAALTQTALETTLKGKPASDFKLPDYGSKQDLCLFDVAGTSHTMLFMVNTDCTACLQELKILEDFRDRYREKANLVVIFTDSSGPGEALDFLDTREIRPDFILHDPELLYPRRSRVSSVPTLIIVGPDGKVAFTRRGYQTRDSQALTADLEKLFVEAPVDKTATPFSEARRIHREADQYRQDGNAEMAALFWERALELYPTAYTLHAYLADSYSELGRTRDAARGYGRYLASQPLAYDSLDVRSKLKSLMESQP